MTSSTGDMRVNPKDGVFRVNIADDIKLEISSQSDNCSLAAYSGWSGSEENGAIASKEFGVVTNAFRTTMFWNGPGLHRSLVQFTKGE